MRWMTKRGFGGLVVAVLIMGTTVTQATQKSARVLTDCNAAAVATAVTAGGLVDINCPAATVLTFGSELVMAQDTEINGNNTVIFDGQNARRVLRSPNNRRITLRNLTIRNGRTNDQGAGINVGFWNNLTITNVRFENNEATKDSAQCDGGGAIFIGGGSVATIDGSTFINNRANNGGAINNLRTKLTVTNSTFDQNKATHTANINQFGDCGGGGAIYIDGGRDPGDGGPDTSVLRDNIYTNNTTNNHGGAIFAGLYTGDTLLVDRSTFENNTATKLGDQGGTGGAIWYGFAAGGVTNERLVLTNSTLANNDAHGQGGGLWVDAPTSISNVTFAGNDATDPNNYPPSDEWRKGNGGALAVAENAPVDINNTTFAINHSGFNGGAIAAGPSVSIKNTLFVNNTSAWSIQIMQHCTEALTDGGNNLQYPPKNPNLNYWNETNCTTNIGTPTLTLGGLANNGGATKTMALPAGSPAINAGNTATCTATDQRDYPRVGVCDVGAYEFKPLVVTDVVYIPLVQR